MNRGAELTKQPQQTPAGASQAGAASSPQWTRADWISLATITALAAITRLIGLTAITGDGTPVFDEKHYAPQAFDIAVSATNPLTGGIESNPGYGLVVHPPLAKQIMAWGNTLFGYTPMGWRISAALVGILVVLAIMGLTRSLTRSTLVMTIAGLLAVFDGVLLVISRYGMLDIFQTLFVILAAWAWVLDRRDVTTRLETTIAGTTVPYQPGYPSSLQWGILGPRLGFRWWRFTTGLCLGLALSVKWSGLYYIAFFGLISVGADYWLRRRAGIRAPLPGALLRDAPSAFASLVILPIAIYAWSWRLVRLRNRRLPARRTKQRRNRRTLRPTSHRHIQLAVLPRQRAALPHHPDQQLRPPTPVGIQALAMASRHPPHPVLFHTRPELPRHHQLLPRRLPLRHTTDLVGHRPRPTLGTVGRNRTPRKPLLATPGTFSRRLAAMDAGIRPANVLLLRNRTGAF